MTGPRQTWPSHMLALLALQYDHCADTHHRALTTGMQHGSRIAIIMAAAMIYAPQPLAALAATGMYRPGGASARGSDSCCTD